MREIEDLQELFNNLNERVEKLENDRRINGFVLGILIVAVSYLFFR